MIPTYNFRYGVNNVNCKNKIRLLFISHVNIAKSQNENETFFGSPQSIVNNSPYNEFNCGTGYYSNRINFLIYCVIPA